MVRIRGSRFDQMDAERVARFIKAMAELYAPSRFVRITSSVLVLRRVDPEPIAAAAS